MTIPTARIAQYDATRETSNVSWSDDTKGEYSLRGGLAWPVSTPTGKPGGDFVIQGYALMCAVNVATDCVTVVEHTPFNAIDPAFDEDGQPRQDIEPLVPFLLRCWSRYYANRFYWHDSGETNRQYRNLIIRNDLIHPKPIMTRIYWQSDEAVTQVMWNVVNAGKLVIPEKLYQDVMTGDMATGGWLSPARHALLVCLVGMQRFPWRAKEKE